MKVYLAWVGYDDGDRLVGVYSTESAALAVAKDEKSTPYQEILSRWVQWREVDTNKGDYVWRSWL